MENMCDTIHILLDYYFFLLIIVLYYPVSDQECSSPATADRS
jgi:hypothetical protein